jgi:hypothetical protein
MKASSRILVKRLWFPDHNALKRQQAETASELDALLPAILDRAFIGELCKLSKRCATTSSAK